MKAGPPLMAAAIGFVTALTVTVLSRAPRDYVQCARGFAAEGARCRPIAACPAPLAPTSRGCEAPPSHVRIPATELSIGPADWEAEGRVPPRTVRVAAFELDAFEVTVGAFDPRAMTDLARAAAGMTQEDAARFCASRGGRLPTDDEWLAAAAGAETRRYPWGTTGAVCRRAAWGLVEGPCARGADGPDTVGAHSEGDTPGGLHDMAGNVAEWTDGSRLTKAGERVAVVRGGSFRSALATDLRTWSFWTKDPVGRSDDVGFRCAYGTGRP